MRPGLNEFPDICFKSRSMNPVYIIDTVRTPVGRYGGILSSIRPDDLLAYIIRALLRRNETVDPAAIVM